MKHYLTILCRLCEINGNLDETPGKRFLSGIQRNIPIMAYGHPAAYMIQITSPEPVFSPLFKSSIEQDTSFFILSLKNSIKESGRRLADIESVLYRKSLEEGVIDNDDYVKLVNRDVIPVRIYAKDSNNAVPLIDDAFKLFKGKRDFN